MHERKPWTLLRVTDGAFHFWDATDDFSATNMDLLFETDRLYLHKATGFFGAVPMSITGAFHSMCCTDRILDKAARASPLESGLRNHALVIGLNHAGMMSCDSLDEVQEPVFVEFCQNLVLVYRNLLKCGLPPPVSRSAK